MEQSLWGGRIVMTSVISMLLILVSFIFPYYEVGNDGIYVVSSLNEGHDLYPDDLLDLSEWIGLLAFVCVLLNLAYIGMVMKGERWSSMYVGGVSIIALVGGMTYYAYRADAIMADLQELNPSHTYSHVLSGGFRLLALATLVSTFSVVMRGWILGVKAKGEYETLADDKDDVSDTLFSSEPRTKD